MRRSAAGLPAISPLILAVSILSAATAVAQPPDQGTGGPVARRPFAKPGAPRQVERVRTFDVTHIKGELTLDVKKSEIRGTVTHSITPLHPGLDALTLDCGADLKVSRVDDRHQRPAPSIQKAEDAGIIALGRASGPGETFEVAVTYAGSPEKGVRFVKPDADHPNRADPLASGPSANPRMPASGSPASTIPNERVDLRDDRHR